MRPIAWLAAFPKSGNTWLRLLLASMSADAGRDINDMGWLGGMASARPRFDDACLVASGLLSHDECDRMRPALYRHAAQSKPVRDDLLGHWHLIMTHDAWTHTALGEPLLGGAGVAHGAVLIVRDPRDVVASLANHIGGTVEEAVAMMAHPASTLAYSLNCEALVMAWVNPGSRKFLAETPPRGWIAQTARDALNWLEPHRSTRHPGIGRSLLVMVAGHPMELGNHP